jgi:shikimate kinase
MRKIYLWGQMGSGKSYLGERLAEAMQLPFVDLDDRIETEAHKSIRELFEEEGEAVFRKKEQQALLDFIRTQKEGILATGGGAPCFFDNAERMNQSGITFYLRTPISVLVNRLWSEASHRPLLRGNTKEAFADFLQNQLTERTPFYEKAHLIYESKSLDGKEMVEELRSYLRSLGF